MSSKIKNILIFVVVIAILALVYFFFLKKEPEQPSLVSTGGTTIPTSTEKLPEEQSSITSEFLTLLLNVKGIKINDSVLSLPAFSALRDSTIEIVNDGTEGRANPFAPIGSDVSNIMPQTNTMQTLNTLNPVIQNTTSSTTPNPPANTTIPPVVTQ